MPIACSSETLADLAAQSPDLVDAASGLRTGIRFVKTLGTGGMSTVFLAERVEPAAGGILNDETPRTLAVKVLQPSTATSLDRYGLKPIEFVMKEVVALQRLSALRPRSENVIDYYGAGEMDVSVRSRTVRLPWIAVELVDGGNAGLSLTDRVSRASAGIDPLRALRLVRAIAQGLAAVHSVGVIHRDLKPENILVAGAVDDEQPKLSDCGIARVSGIQTSLLAAVTPEYGGIEQFLPASPAGNPLVGPWTDVHAFAAVIWFILGGEQWHRDVAQQPVNPEWLAGDRRSIRTAARLHPGFADEKVMNALDTVLVRGASSTLPAACIQGEHAQRMQRMITQRWPSASRRPERYPDLSHFMAALDPVLASAADEWRKRAAREKKPATQFRPTIALSPLDLVSTATGYSTTVHPPERLPTGFATKSAVLARNLVAHYPDGTAVARSPQGLVHLRERKAHSIRLPADERLPAILDSALRMLHVDHFGCAIVSARGIAFVRSNTVSVLEPPRVAGREVGDIVSVHRYGGRLAVVTDETDDTEGAAEIWWTADATSWSDPTPVVLNGGRAKASSEGPYGTLVVGTRDSRGKVSACAAFVANDGTSNSYAKGLGSIAGLTAALSGAEHDSWAAAGATVVRLSRGVLVSEPVEGAPEEQDTWAELGLDLMGAPWLLTERAVFRREIQEEKVFWLCVYVRPPGGATFVSLYFTPEGAFALDREFNTVQVVPSDIARWASP